MRSCGMEVLFGVDSHKATNAAVAIDEHGELVGQAVFPTNRRGIRALGEALRETPLAALRKEGLARVHPEDGLEGRVEILRFSPRGERI